MDEAIDRARHGAGDAALRRLVDQVPAMVSYWDTQHRNRMANAAFGQWLGVDPDGIAGTHASAVLGAERYAQSLPFIEAALAGQRQEFDRTLIDGQGNRRHTHASFVPDVVDGVVVGVVALVTDVTRQVDAEQRLLRWVELYRSLARSMPNSFVLVFDTELRFVVADGPALGAFSLSSAQIEGRTLWELLPDRSGELEENYRAALRGESRTWERVVGRRFITLSASPSGARTARSWPDWWSAPTSPRSTGAI